VRSEQGPTSGPTSGPDVGPTSGPTSDPTSRATSGPTSGPNRGPTSGPTSGTHLDRHLGLIVVLRQVLPPEQVVVQYPAQHRGLLSGGPKIIVFQSICSSQYLLFTGKDVSGNI
jgi:hypothetical protein